LWEENPVVTSEPVREAEQVVESGLDLILHGTMVNPARDSWAIISEKGKNAPQEIIQVGDSIKNATVERIERYAVYLRNNARLEVITMEEQKAKDRFAKQAGHKPQIAVSRPGVNFELPRKEFSDYLARGISVLKGTSFAPFNEGANTLGYQLKLSGTSVFHDFGLKTGDIVESINGISVTDSGKLASLMRNMNKQSSLELNILRNGEARAVTVNIR